MRLGETKSSFFSNSNSPGVRAYPRYLGDPKWEIGISESETSGTAAVVNMLGYASHPDDRALLSQTSRVREPSAQQARARAEATRRALTAPARGCRLYTYSAKNPAYNREPERTRKTEDRATNGARAPRAHAPRASHALRHVCGWNERRCTRPVRDAVDARGSPAPPEARSWTRGGLVRR